MDYSVEQEFRKVWQVLKCKVKCNFLGGVYSIPEYADNSSALLAGLVVGNLYHTLGVIKIVI